MIGPFRGNYEFLSNFYKLPMEYKGKVFPTAEHAYQWEKAASDEDKRLVGLQRTPGQAARLSRRCRYCHHDRDRHAFVGADHYQCSGGEAPCACNRFVPKLVMRPDWEDVLREDWPERGDTWLVKHQAMLDVVRAKFERGGRMAAWLDNTGDDELVELNWWGDFFWGRAWDEENRTWVGDNWLGRILMLRRHELRSGVDSEEGEMGYLRGETLERVMDDAVEALQEELADGKSPEAVIAAITTAVVEEVHEAVLHDLWEAYRQSDSARRTEGERQAAEAQRRR